MWSAQHVWRIYMLWHDCRCKASTSIVVAVQLLSRVRLLVTPGAPALQASLSFTISWSFSHPLSRWCHPAISPSVVPFSSCLQSFPASGSFPVSWLFSSGGQSIGASASALWMSIQGWFPWGLTGLIAPLSHHINIVSVSVVGIIKIYLLSKFGDYNALLLSLFTVPCLWFLGLTVYKLQICTLNTISVPRPQPLVAMTLLLLLCLALLDSTCKQNLHFFFQHLLLPDITLCAYLYLFLEHQLSNGWDCGHCRAPASRTGPGPWRLLTKCVTMRSPTWKARMGFLPFTNLSPLVSDKEAACWSRRTLNYWWSFGLNIFQRPVSLLALAVNSVILFNLFFFFFVFHFS